MLYRKSLSIPKAFVILFLMFSSSSVVAESRPKSLPDYKQILQILKGKKPIADRAAEELLLYLENFMFPAMKSATNSSTALKEFKTISLAVREVIDRIESSSNMDVLRFKLSVNLEAAAESNSFVYDLQSRFYTLKFLSSSFAEKPNPGERSAIPWEFKPVADEVFAMNISYALLKFFTSGRPMLDLKDFLEIALNIRENEIKDFQKYISKHREENLKSIAVEDFDRIRDEISFETSKRSLSGFESVLTSIVDENERFLNALESSKGRISKKSYRFNKKYSTRAALNSVFILLKVKGKKLSDYPEIQEKLSSRYSWLRLFYLDTSTDLAFFKNSFVRITRINYCRYSLNSN